MTTTAAASPPASAPLRIVLMCHHDAPLHHDGLARWLAARGALAGVVVVEEPASLLKKRLRRERRRVGTLRLLDVIAFRLFYRLALAGRDRAWQAERLAAMRAAYPPVPADLPVLRTHSPNAPEVEAFLRRLAPDAAVALLKSIIRESVFAVPTHGTWVWHPGICPEYRNAHGCFWALANDDVGNVGLTLLRIDRGVDTGPTFGYFTYDFDEVRESHVVIQNRVALDNLDAILQRMTDAAVGRAAPLDVNGRRSAVWGQPWLTKYVHWKRAARTRRRAAARNPQTEEGARAGARAAVS